MQVKGTVTATVWIECPHCGHEYDALERNEDAALVEAVFDPQKWGNVGIKLKCHECAEGFTLGSMVW